MRHAAFVLFTLASLVPASSALSATRDLPELTFEEGLKAYQDICLSHVGDLAAQVAAAKAAPYNMAIARGEGSNVIYDNARMFAALKDEDGRQYCMIGTHIADTDAKAAAAQLEKSFPVDVVRIRDRPGEYGWAIPDLKPLTLYTYAQESREGILTASYMVGVITK